MENTIVAISTAPGNAGIGIVRLSGEKSIDIIKKIFKAKNPRNIKGYSIKLGTIFDEEGNVIDEVLVSYFFAPKSYTGENMCEINSHGNMVVLKRILELCIKNGAKLAEPGEFTKRAFINGRIDLVQAEAVIDIINSKSELERKAAIQGLEGYLSNDIKLIKKDILEILSNIEVSIDYPEYDIEEEDNEVIIEKSKMVLKKLEDLKNTFQRGKILRDGVSVAIVGSPNAGKSSLLNTLIREEKAIVTDIEGTTRDIIEEFINIKGIPFKIIDTAGIRKAKDTIEKIGIEKSIKALKEADLVIAIFDKTKNLSEEDLRILNDIKEKEAIILLNKIDLQEEKIERKIIDKINKPIIEISARNDIGINELYNKMAETFYKGNIESDNTKIITNIRHKEAIEKAMKAIRMAIDTIEDGMPTDMSAIYYKEGIKEINEITGENVTEDIINDIFSKFCLGK